jgi:hypothetical protein
MDATLFRSITAPAFIDPNKYPDSVIDFWIAQAAGRMRPEVWGERLDEGTMYFVAHHIAMTARNGRSGAGSTSGLVASKSVGGASISYDNSAVVSVDAGTFNLTGWGQQYWQLVQLVGMGVVQVSPNPIRGAFGYRYPNVRY